MGTDFYRPTSSEMKVGGSDSNKMKNIPYLDTPKIYMKKQFSYYLYSYIKIFV